MASLIQWLDQHHIKPGRETEWLFAMALLMSALTFAVPGSTFYPIGSTAAFYRVAPEWVWALTFFGVGALRVCALIVNGRAPLGSPLARIFGAITSLMLWSFMFASFLHSTPVGRWAAAFTAVFCAFEARVVIIASTELKRAQVRRKSVA